MDRLSIGEKVAGVAAVLLFIVMFLSWFGAPGEAGEALEQAQQFGFAQDIDTTANAWQSFGFIDIVLFVTIVATLGAIGLRLAGSELDVPASTLVTLLGALSTLLVLYRLIDPPSGAGREIGVWLGLVLSAAIAYGGYRAMDEEGTSFGDTADRLSGGAGSAGDEAAEGGSPPPPPPPPPASGGRP